jgi:hypothetical protein
MAPSHQTAPLIRPEKKNLVFRRHTLEFCSEQLADQNMCGVPGTRNTSCLLCLCEQRPDSGRRAPAKYLPSIFEQKLKCVSRSGRSPSRTSSSALQITHSVQSGNRKVGTLAGEYYTLCAIHHAEAEGDFPGYRFYFVFFLGKLAF